MKIILPEVYLSTRQGRIQREPMGATAHALPEMTKGAQRPAGDGRYAILSSALISTFAYSS